MPEDNVAYDAVSQKEENGDTKNATPEVPKGFGVRHTQALILFTCLTVGLMMRAHLSVSLVAMTSNSTLEIWYPNTCLRVNISDNNVTTEEALIEYDDQEDEISKIAEEYIKQANDSASNKVFNDTRVTKRDVKNKINETDTKSIVEVNTEKNINCEELKKKIEGWTVYKVYNWNPATQEMILFSFFVGYTGMMMPMGILAQRFGGKIPIVVAMGVNGVLSLLTPWMPIFCGWLGVCIVRLLQGMTQAAFYPSIQTILGRWAPLNERGRLSSYIYGGSQFGTIVSFQLAGLFAGSPNLGWPVSFWIFGALSLVCCGVLAWFGAATPYDHPSISSEELLFIAGGSSADFVMKRRRTPWKKILTSPAVWGLVVTHVGSAMGYIFILTEIPLYMNKIVGVNIKKNGVYSSLPYISMYLMSILFGYLTDLALSKKIMSVANVRRLANSIGLLGMSVFLVAFGYANSPLVCVVLLVLALGTHSGIHVGFLINSIDLSPNFAGSIMALGNMLGNLGSLLIPVFVSCIIGEDVANQHKWQILFWIMASIQVVTNTVFVMFAKGTVQSWNFYDGDKEDAEKDKSHLEEKTEIKLQSK